MPYGARHNIKLIGLSLALLVAAAWLAPAKANPEIWKRTGWAETDFSKTSIDFTEITSGGPSKDDIPSIDNPVFEPVVAITNIGPEEPVLSLEHDGRARAYPLRVLMWHEIVNDQIGDLPLTITYCPLCNAAIVFDRRLDGEVLDFGTTGMLRNSDLVMYDRQSQSWWQQFTGEAIVGALTGKRLTRFPSRLESFSQFAARHRDGEVLVPNNPGARDYGRNPYAGYDAPGGVAFLYDGDLPDGIAAMSRILAIEVDGKAKAWTFDYLRANAPFEEGDLLITWQAGQNSALDNRRINQGRDIGTALVQRKTENGLEDIIHEVPFAFAFHAFNPDVPIIDSTHH